MPLLQAKKQRGGLLSANPLLAIGQGLLQAGANGDNIGLGLANGLQGYEQGLRQQQEDELQANQYAAQERFQNSQMARSQFDMENAQADRARLDATRQKATEWAAGLEDGNPLKQFASVDPVATFELYGKILAQKPNEAPSGVQEYEYAVKNGFKGSFLDFQTQLRKAGASSSTISFGAPVAGRDANGNDVFIRPDNQGGMTVVPGVKPPARSDQQPTQDERQSALLLQRLRRAQGDMSSVIKAAPGSERPEVLGSIVGAVGGETARNFANSEDRQRIEAAQMDALDAALTLATGAAYTKDQLEMQRRSHFPQIGDTPATAAEKNKRFTDLVKDAEIRAGRAAPNLAPVQPTSPAPGDGATATNPTTGQKLIRRGGKWEPVQ